MTRNLLLVVFVTGALSFGCSEKKAESVDTERGDTTYVQKGLDERALHVDSSGSPGSMSPVEGQNPSFPDSDSLKFCVDLPFLDYHDRGWEKAVGISNAWWPANTTELIVQFLDGDSAVIKKVITVANYWQPYSGIKFKLNDKDSFGHITVSFKGAGTWSAIGRQARLKYPSMNLRGLTSSSSDWEYRRVVLHEFGHALGLIHEHQNPRSTPIEWDVRYVKQYFKGILSPDEIERNIFKKYDKHSTNGTDYDSLSIMMYAIPAEFRRSRISTPWNTELSRIDMSFIGSKYKDNPILTLAK